jgi:uncharacterized repeat protein (TIGR01451 family)
MKRRVTASASALLTGSLSCVEAPKNERRQPPISIAVTLAAAMALFSSASSAGELATFGAVTEARSRYAGDAATVGALDSGAVRPLSVASADFDRNGTPDLVIGYASATGGVLTLQRGNPDAFAPADDSVFVRMQQGYDPESLLLAASALEVPEAPDFLVAGTFGNGEPGVLFARKGGALYLLPGDARGGFGAPRRIPLPGPVTALAAGEFRGADGYTDIAVGVATPTGGSLLVFDDAIDGFTRALAALPSTAPVTAIEFGGLDDDSFLDVAAVSDGELMVLHGWSRAGQEKAGARLERIAVGRDTVGLAIGAFVWDRVGRSEIATLSAAGEVQIVRAADLDMRPFTAAEAALRTRGLMPAHGTRLRDPEAAPSWRAKRASGWVTTSPIQVGRPKRNGAAAARPLLRANLSYRESDDLMVVGELGVEVVHEVARLQKSGAAIPASALKRTALPGSGHPVAVLALPKKLNGVRDFVVLDAGRTKAVLAPQAPNTTITVDRVDDSAAASACTAAGNDCSLRGALTFANNPTNNNTTISIPAGTYALSINGGSANGCDGNATGDLAANQTMSLVGAGAATTIIRQTGTGPANDGDRVMCMCEAFTENLIYNFSGITFSGGRDGTAAGTGSSIGGSGIIGGERGNSLTLTSVVFTNNQGTVLGSGNIGGGGLQITGGDLIITNSTFGGSNAPPVYTDRASTNVGNAQATSGGGVMFTPSAPMHTGGNGVLTVSGSTFSRNTAGSICCGGAGLDLVIFAFASPGGIGTGSASIGTTTISNNQSTAATGGAIDVESLPTTLTGSTSLISNFAANRGGAVYVGGASLHLNGASGPITFTGNTSGSGIGTSLSTASAVTVSGTGTTIGGSMSISTGGSFSMNAGSTLAPTDVLIAGGTFNTNASTVNIGGNLTIEPEPVVGGTFNGGTGTVNLAGNFVLTAGGSPATSLNAGSGTATFNFNGTGAQSISNGTAITFNHLTNSNITQPLTLNNSLAVNGTLNVNGANAVLSPAAGAVVSGSGTLTGTGTARVSRIAATADFLTQYSLTNKTLTNLTVDYSGAGSQTINHVPAYSHLRVSGSGTKTLQGNATITGNLTTVAGATFASGNNNFSLGGQWSNAGTFTPGTGTVTFAGSTGTQLLTGNTTFFNLTLNNPGAITSFGSTTTTVQNDLAAVAGTMDGSTSTLVFTGTGDNAGALTGAGAKNFHNLQINSPATLSHSAGGNVAIEGNYANAGTFSQAAAATTTFQVDNAADGAHTLSGAGATTFGNLTIDASNTVDAGSHSFNVLGAAFAAAGTFTGNTGTVTFNGATAQTVSGDGAKNFNSLSINNAAGVLVANGAGAVDASVAGALNLATDLTVAASGGVLRQTGTSSGTSDVIGTVRRIDLGVTTRAFGHPNEQVTVNSGTAPTQLDFDLAKTTPAGFPAATKVVPRALVLTPTGGTGMSVTLRARYADAELAGPGITESRLGLWKRIGGIWTPQGGTVDTTNNFVSLAGIASFSEWGIAELSDLSLAKANSVGGAAVVGQPWNWTLTAANAGSPATFAMGQTILTDTLPASGLAYGAVSVTNFNNIAGGASIGCSIVGNVLTCTATTGSVSFLSNFGASSFDVVFSATPQSAGMFQNPPAASIARIDPNDHIVESASANNDPTANAVTVGKANTTTTITGDSPDPSVAGFVATVTWSVAVTAPGALGAALTGNVTVSDGTSSCVAAVSAGQCDLTFTSGGSKNLTATYAGDGNYNGSASGTATHVVTVEKPTLAKAFVPATIVSQGSSTVTLTLSNSNGIALTGAAFTDTLAGMSAAGGTVTGTCAGTTPATLGAGATALSFTGITIPAQGSCTVEFTVTSSTPGVLPNTTSGVASTQSGSAGAVSNTANLTVTPAADLSITKTDGAAAAVPGNPLTYTIVASNAGPNAATGASVDDAFPATLTGCTWTCVGAGGGTCTASGAGSIADTANLPVGGSAAYTATCTLSAAAAGSLSNTATVVVPPGTTDAVPANNSATDVDTLPPRDLTLVKANNVSGAAVVGQPWSWTVTAANGGAPAIFAAGQTILIDDLPGPGMVYGAASVQNASNISGSANLGCAIAAGTLTCTAVGGSVQFDSNLGASQFDVVFSATAQVAGAQQNPRAGGVALADPGGVVSESNEGNNAALANTVTVGRAATTTTISSHSPDPSVVGLPLTVQWGVTVGAPGALGTPLTGNVTVSDGTDSCTAPVAAGQCALTFGSGGSKSLTATYAGDGNYDGSASGAVAHAVTVNPPAIAKAFLPSSIAAGGSSVVTLTLSNSNGISLTDGSFTDPLTSMSAAGGAVTGSCAGTTPNTLAASATALAFSGITIPPQGSCTVVFALTSNTLGALPNTTSGVATTQTPLAGNASNTATLTVSPGADLSVALSDGSTVATPGSPVIYTLVASNAGPSDVTDATVTDTFPPELSGCGWTCVAGSGSCAPAGFGNIADATVDLPNGGSVTYSATCTLSAAAVGDLSNTATVTAPGGVVDPVPGNNNATDVDTLPPRPDLTIAKSHTGTFVQGQTGRTYDIVVSNEGTAATDGSTITVTDMVPPGLTPTAASGSGWSCGIASQTVTCTSTGVVNAGAAAPALVVTVSVANDAPALIVNTASVAGGGNPVSANDSDDDPTAIVGLRVFANGFEGN